MTVASLIAKWMNFGFCNSFLGWCFGLLFYFAGLRRGSALKAYFACLVLTCGRKEGFELDLAAFLACSILRL